MGSVHRFKRPRRSSAPSSRFLGSPRRRFHVPDLLLFGIAVPVGIFVGSVLFERVFHPADPPGAAFSCRSVKVTDGDTLRCDGKRVRLAGIDAPELPGHCRKGRDCTPGDPYASTDNLEMLVATGPVVCAQSDIDVYGRIVARCTSGGTDLSCQQIEDGHAVRRYGSIAC